MELERLQLVIAGVLSLDPKEITMDTILIDDLGADSLDLFQIVMGIEEEFGIAITEEETLSIVTVAQVVELIQSKKPF